MCLTTYLNFKQVFSNKILTYSDYLIIQIPNYIQYIEQNSVEFIFDLIYIHNINGQNNNYNSCEFNFGD